MFRVIEPLEVHLHIRSPGTNSLPALHGSSHVRWRLHRWPLRPSGNSAASNWLLADPGCDRSVSKRLFQCCLSESCAMLTGSSSTPVCSPLYIVLPN